MYSYTLNHLGLLHFVFYHESPLVQHPNKSSTDTNDTSLEILLDVGMKFPTCLIPEGHVFSKLSLFPHIVFTRHT